MAEIELIVELQEQLNRGDFLTLNEVTTSFNNMMHNYGIEDMNITRPELLTKVQRSIINFTFLLLQRGKSQQSSTVKMLVYLL